MAHKYRMKYLVEFGEFDKDDLKAQVPQVGGCDELIMCSYVQFDDGGGSYMWISSNGRPNEDMAPSRVFRAFGALAKQLSEDQLLAPANREACRQAFELVRTEITKGRAVKHEPQ
jgi:hypothetical protein